MPDAQPTTTVIICAYTDARYEQTIDAARSVLGQEPGPLEVVLVVDHNAPLASRLRAALPEVEVIESVGARGLSGARNTGVARARGALVAFLDDDASARRGWLAAIEAAATDPSVMMVAGLAIPEWQGGAPSWFPPEYLWVVGCSYQGQHVGPAMRNPIGCNMAIRARALEVAGGFHTAVGRIGALPVGAEETELALRIRAAIPTARVAFARDAVVDHRVPAGRGSLRYFVSRCYHEGVSKAVLSRLASTYRRSGASAALASERAYVLRTLPRGMLRRIAAIRRAGDVAPAVGGAVMIVVGVAAAAVGYARGSLRAMGEGGSREGGGR